MLRHSMGFRQFSALRDKYRWSLYLFFFNDAATTDIYTLSLHDALPIFHLSGGPPEAGGMGGLGDGGLIHRAVVRCRAAAGGGRGARHVPHRLPAALGVSRVPQGRRLPRKHDVRALVLRAVPQVDAGTRRVL